MVKLCVAHIGYMISKDQSPEKDIVFGKTECQTRREILHEKDQHNHHNRLKMKDDGDVTGPMFLSAKGGEQDQDDNENHEYKISISGKTVTLECPLSGEIKWEKNGKTLGSSEPVYTMVDFSEVDNSGCYACYNNENDKKYFLYLKARVCENCLELDPLVVIAIVIVDVCITLGLLLVVYYWSKNRKAKSKPVTRGAASGGRPRGQKKEKPPPVPNPDYEPIRKGQRDLYAGLNQRNI
ncbi:PREDICTED: T-cell surface glycoprotein CD3 epsilon chain [Elephantulus edwardii]|uniref:T-cell surface glycoprotein CD3 epsilon chain n=1 Tax=Elephantulus edwardii TaxID=28737 RepID=UPI0003F0C48A|nr:PREDICTED: T-cell surface glycoprotein CD3 epsilon chain [Elephantulus edwardii]